MGLAEKSHGDRIFGNVKIRGGWLKRVILVGFLEMKKFEGHAEKTHVGKIFGNEKNFDGAG